MTEHRSDQHTQPLESDQYLVYGLRFDLRDDPELWKLTLSQLNERYPFRAQQLNVIAGELSGGDILVKEGILKGFMLSEELRLRTEVATTVHEAQDEQVNNVVGLSWLRKRRERRQARVGKHAISVSGGDAA